LRASALPPAEIAVEIIVLVVTLLLVLVTWLLYRLAAGLQASK
jgi:hypothetical protein